MKKAERLAVAFAVGVGFGLVIHATQTVYGVFIQCGLITWPWC